MAKVGYGVQLANGKWLSRARFDASWDGAFQLDHPELWDTYLEAVAAGAPHAPATVVPFDGPMTRADIETEIERLRARYAAMAPPNEGNADEEKHSP